MKATIGVVLSLTAWAFACAAADRSASPPGQPAEGPGGAESSFREVVAHRYGDGPRAYWLFEPARPKPAEAPLIVFNHGWSAMLPQIYGAWIEHLVKRGNIVLYPLYQDSLLTPAADFTANAVAGIKSGIERLQTETGHVKPRLDQFAVVGHSMGGVVAANLAATWEKNGLPRPRAVMCVQPGKTWPESSPVVISLADLGSIARETLLLTVVGDRDQIVGEVDAKRIYYESTRVPAENKNYVSLISDDHGRRALEANHFAPVAPGGDFGNSASGALRQRLRAAAAERRGEAVDVSGASKGPGLDALDFYGTWKLLDGLTDAAFYGRNRKYALGNTPEQRFMGRWSDGVAVKEMVVREKP